MENKKIYKIILYISYSLLIGVFSMFTLSFTGFILHLKINSFYPVISYVISQIVLYYCLKKENYTKPFLVVSLVQTGLIILSLLFGNKFIDYWADGLTYHQGAIMLLGNGWNPIYTNVYDFAYKLYPTKLHFLIYIENYPKFTEIIWANIFVLFKNIEISKMINILSMFITAGYIFYVLSKNFFRPINNSIKTLLVFLFIINPVYIAQFMTYYNDAYIYLFFCQILFSIIDIETSENRNLIAYSILLMSSVCLVNIKLGGLLYFVVTILCYSLYLCIKKSKTRLKNLGIISLAILVLWVISGINPYITNIAKGRNPFYPLAGKYKEDLVTPVTPKDFLNKYNIHTLLLSTFSEVNNPDPAPNGAIHLKLPFSVHKEEIFFLGDPDIRVCGFGIFWSGIILLSTILIFSVRYNSTREKHLFYLIYTILALATILHPYCWWARYASHLWLIPIFILFAFFLNTRNNKFYTIIAYMTILFVIANFLVQFIGVKNTESNHRKMITDAMELLRKNPKTIRIYSMFDWSFIEKLKENNIDFKIVDDQYYYNHYDEFIPAEYALYDFAAREGTSWDYHRDDNN